MKIPTSNVVQGPQGAPSEAEMLMALAENNLEKRVYVRGDEAVPYGAVVSVLALLQRAGFKNAGLPVDANAANRILSEGG